MAANTVNAIGWGTKDSSGILTPLKFTRRATGHKDVQFKVMFCGVCHSDLHLIKNDWGFANYPMIPGHEIVGLVTEALLNLLKPNGKLIVVGLPERPLELPMFALATHRKMVGGSMIGGIKETQEMIDFAAKHNILPDVEVISMDYINTAMERLARADVKYRFVIDVGKTLKAEN
ncbi:Probable cinnamyl alcohol dehydrogenase 9 [Striga hermonthica]|uniref:Probable cinnamyl alcohol dehydrogenase 9 n=1 Tax=Striga hermonthica TaxID=68872 RepID=A0A9N7MUM6_STRHE|nr:Probable cinnamyl alcohol dehydrogenase 9 [Striga hermonthica]